MADAGNIVVGAGGRVWVAPEGTTAPTDSTTALAGAFVDLGFVTEEGVKFSDTIEKKLVRAWNARRPVRRIAGNATTLLDFGLLEWNAATFVFAMGGGDLTGITGAVAEVEAVALASLADTDSFYLTWNAAESTEIVADFTGPDTGTYNAAGIQAAIEGIAGFTADVTVDEVTTTGFRVTWDDAGAQTDGPLTVTNGTGGVTGLVAVLIAGAAATGTEAVFVPDQDSDDFRSLVVEWADGTKNYRLYVPKGVTTGSIEVALTQTDESPLPVSFEAMPDEGDDPYSLFTDDPSF
jgi:hypothetical protein